MFIKNTIGRVAVSKIDEHLASKSTHRQPPTASAWPRAELLNAIEPASLGPIEKLDVPGSLVACGHHGDCHEAAKRVTAVAWRGGGAVWRAAR
jgi:hypothetical protein